MSDLFGIGGLDWVAVFAGALLCLIVLLVGMRLRRWRATHEDHLETGQTRARLAVLESTMLDAQRHLVLVACDDVEHLIMIGGPADLVIENDVGRDRGAMRSASRFGAGHETIGRSAASTTGEVLAEVVAPKLEPAAHAAEISPEPRVGEPKPAEAKRQAGKPDGQIRAAAANRPALAAVPAIPNPPAGKNSLAPASTISVHPAVATRTVGNDAAADRPRRVEPPGASGLAAEPKPAEPGEMRAAGPKQVAEPQFGRRDPPAAAPAAVPVPMPPVAPPPAVAIVANEPTVAAGNVAHEAAAPSDAAAKPDTTSGKQAGLPAVELPWPEGDSVENEIMKALSTDMRPAPKDDSVKPPSPDPTPVAKASSPATTLGDLADRLEEALAREVQAGQKGGRLDLDLDAFGFDREAAVEKPKPAPAAAPDLRATPEQRPPGDRKLKGEAARAVPASPEAEGRREARAHIERQDEAPVISLNARRKEPVDPLEDEMARLLGELTGDSSRR